MELTLSAYLKQLITPQIAVKICNHKFEGVVSDLKEEAIESLIKLIIDEEIEETKLLIDFVETLGFIVQENFLKNEELALVDEIDNAFYLLVGRMLKVGIGLNAVKPMLLECFESFYGLKNEQINQIVEKYKNMKNELPNQINGAVQ